MFCGQSWSTVTPFPEQLSFGFSFNLGVPLGSGDFVQFKFLDNSYVGRIVAVEPDDMTYSNNVVVNYWPKLSELVAAELTDINCLNPVEHNYIIGMDEVLWSNLLLKIDIEDISEIAFVFHAKSIQSGQFCVNGMKHSFVVRYRIWYYHPPGEESPNSHYGLVSSLKDNKFCPFPTNLVIDSYPSRVFMFLNVIKNSVNSILYSKGKHKKLSTFVEMYISRDTWGYIHRQLACSTEIIQMKKKRSLRVRHNYFHDLSMSSSQVLSKKETFVAKTSEQQSFIRSIFGKSFLLGVRKRPSFKSYGKKPGLLSIGDEVNVVGNNFSSLNQSNRPNGNMVSFSFDNISGKLRICIQFTRYVLDDSETSQRILESLRNKVNDSYNEELTKISVGDCFIRKGLLWKVSEMSSDSMYKCTLIDGSRNKKFSETELLLLLSNSNN